MNAMLGTCSSCNVRRYVVPIGRLLVCAECTRALNALWSKNQVVVAREALAAEEEAKKEKKQ